jgi:predicted nucleic acid-binding protein
MRIYLDNCCLNRPFDDQTQLRIRLETEAKLAIQDQVRCKRQELAWSYIIDFENAANPFDDRREAIQRWRTEAVIDVDESAKVLTLASRMESNGLRAKDALHLACAIAARCDVFLTTDDVVLKKMRGSSDIMVLSPTDFIVQAG